MKRKLTKIFGVSLTLVMVLSLMVAFAPVATAADYEENDWGEWGLPSLDEGTDVGPMAVAPDGTLYAAVDDGTDYILQKSEDNGYTWDDTNLDDATAVIVSVAVSPNYGEDETVYVGCIDGTVYRVEEAGEGDVIAIKDIVDKFGTTASALYCIDVWTDEDDYNWIMVATNLDVLVLQDKRFADWQDQELATGGAFWVAYEVAFAPDFEDSDIIWAVIDDAPGGGDDFLVTATASPGKWGQDIGEVDLDIDASPYLDIDFPDDYDSDPDSGNTNLWVAVTDGAGGGDIILVEGVDAVDGNSNAISMFQDIGGEGTPGVEFTSIAVSGDYGDEIILAGELLSSTVWISDDGGYGWDTVDKSPTGGYWTHVYMGADVVWDGDVFDPDEGMVFASTCGDESAVSRSDDGGMVFNQVGLIDTYIDEIDDLAFHPDFPDTPTYLMTTDNRTTGTTDSVWLTENGDSDEPDYVRVLCGSDSGIGNFDARRIALVEFSQDGDAIYIFGWEDTGSWNDTAIWKSTDDGQTFGKKRSVETGGDNAAINDWVIPEEDTIYAAVGSAGNEGFYMTTNSGLSWSDADTDGEMNDIILSPDFEDDETILLGGTAGTVYMSDDGGDSFDDTGLSLTPTDVFVAFDADYADEDADGYMFIYAASGWDDIQVGEVSDTDDVDWDDLEDDANEATEFASCEGLVVAEDNALYAIDDETGVHELDRLLLHEDDSEWQSANDGPIDPFHLWITQGSDSNVLWTIDDCGIHEGSSPPYTPAIWVLEDTLSGQVTLDSPPDGYTHDREDIIQLAWDEMRGADEYEVSGTESSGLGMDIDEDEIDDTDIVVQTTGSAEYDWKVRVSPGEPWHSRWSDEWTFNTALGPAPWAPTLYTPGGVWQYSGLDVELMPAFSWESAKNADGYQFVLADNAEFASPLVDSKVPESAYNLDFELEYNTNYFWRVMAYDGSKAISRWSDIGAFTTVTKEVPAPSPAPPATVTQPAPAPVVIPTPIPPVLLWTIVGIGALLIIAVIVLIVRTRRAV